ncbi:CheY-like chemotaxis protein [Streptomyces sp. V4I2]|nr:CheY-like chemotaxis protein [Streptomyces sp. V4I2]
MRVVIAEDNALLREGLVLLLTSAGHEVAAVVGSGPEVLPALLEHRPDVAVLDVRMPPGFRDEGLRAALAARGGAAVGDGGPGGVAGEGLSGGSGRRRGAHLRR